MADETTEFLRCVLPADGYYIAVVLDGTRRAQIVCSTIEELARVVLANDQAGRTVYHACASFKDPQGVVNEKTQKTEKRSHQNVKNLRSLFADIDTREGKEDAPYADRKEAYAELNRVVICTQLPQPTVVDSGNGLHCYWPLENEYDFESWTQIAGKFKYLLISNGLKIDPTRTADASSILRTPGTFNRKNAGEPKPVQWWRQDDVRRLSPTDLQRIWEAVPADAGSYGHRASQPVRATQRGSRLARDIIGAPDFPPSDAGRVAAQCAQIGRFRQSGNIPEWLWYAAMGVIAYCVGGREIAHEWSAHDYPGYSQVEVEARLERVVAFPPTTCAKFHSHDPATCERCPLWEKSSPQSCWDRMGVRTQIYQAFKSLPKTDRKVVLENLQVHHYQNYQNPSTGETTENSCSKSKTTTEKKPTP